MSRGWEEEEVGVWSLRAGVFKLCYWTRRDTSSGWAISCSSPSGQRLRLRTGCCRLSAPLLRRGLEKHLALLLRQAQLGGAKNQTSKEPTLRCAQCGGKRVQCGEWIYPNETRRDADGTEWAKVVQGDPLSDLRSATWNWCEECEENVRLVGVEPA